MLKHSFCICRKVLLYVLTSKTHLFLNTYLEINIKKGIKDQTDAKSLGFSVLCLSHLLIFFSPILCIRCIPLVLLLLCIFHQFFCYVLVFLWVWCCEGIFVVVVSLHCQNLYPLFSSRRSQWLFTKQQTTWFLSIS